MPLVGALRIGVLGVIGVALLGLFGSESVFGRSGPAARSLASSGSFRLLYTSDWSGTYEIYAADPSGERATAQVTFGRAPTCARAACGYGDPVPSPNGRFVAYPDWASDSSRRSSLFVARADGTKRRVVARGAAGEAWAPDSKRIAYVVDGRIHVDDIAGYHERIVGAGSRFSWSPDGRSLAFDAATFDPASPRPLSVRRNGRTRIVASAASLFAWSPNSRWLAYTVLHPSGPDLLEIVRADGSSRRLLLSTSYLIGGEPTWSADGRFLSLVNGIETVNVASAVSRDLGDSAALAWEPHGHLLAVAGSSGTSVVDPATGAARRLTSDQAADGAWSPDGRFLAYLTGNPSLYSRSYLRVVTASGAVRAVASPTARLGGDLAQFAWTRVPSSVGYRSARPRVLARLHGDGLTALWAIGHLSADGERVAYTSCGHVFVWTPSARTVVQTEPNSSLSPRCATPGYYLPFWLYTLALSGDRVAFGDLQGNAGQKWGLYTGRVGQAASFMSLDHVGAANACAVGDGGLGDLTGAGGLLVFSTWRDAGISSMCPVPTVEQEIHRVDAGGCPCPTIATSPGPLVPFDVDAGRIVAGGENATLVLNASGAQLLSIPVSPLAAQLSGSDLVVLVRGQLLDYGASTGVRRHAWPLPDVSSASECASPHGGTWACRDARLVLEDAAHGLASYVLDGQVHVLRLADGVDKVVGAGTLARFTDDGIVYADGADLHLVPFAQLPPR